MESLLPLLGIFTIICIGGYIFASMASESKNHDDIKTPSGKILTKEYMKDVERLRRKARQEVDREESGQAHHSYVDPASGALLPDDLTEREAALVQKFVAELRREQGVAAMDESHAEPPPGSTTRKPSIRRNPRSFQDWQGGASGKVREHRTVQ